jgi:hypothetical protein
MCIRLHTLPRGQNDAASDKHRWLVCCAPGKCLPVSASAGAVTQSSCGNTGIHWESRSQCRLRRRCRRAQDPLRWRGTLLPGSACHTGFGSDPDQGQRLLATFSASPLGVSSSSSWLPESSCFRLAFRKRRRCRALICSRFEKARQSRTLHSEQSCYRSAASRHQDV